MQSIDSIETHAYEMNKDIVCKKEEIRCSDIIKQYKNVWLWLNYKKDIKEHNPNLPDVPDHPYGILIVQGSGPGKTNALLNVINHKPYIHKNVLYAKDPYEAKYKKIWRTCIEILKNTIQIKNEKYWSYLKIWLLTCLVIRKKIKYFSYYFVVPKNVRLNSTHYFLMKIPNKRKLQQIPFNHSSDMDFQDFMNFYKKCTAKPYSFLVIDTTLTPDNSSRFIKNPLERM